MKADLSRDSYQRQQGYARVLMQQGRVLLDADWNEQVSILLDQTRLLAADIIGPHGGPGSGFKISCSEDLPCDFEIGWGRYYVDGIACELAPDLHCPPMEAPEPVRYLSQRDYPVEKGGAAELETGGRYLVYLDVWERHLNHLQAEGIRELALGGPDTATRARIVCQVKAAPLGKIVGDDLTCQEMLDALVGDDLRLPRCLRARARVDMPSEDPCLVPPTAQFRGPENQLYRVEIHDPGGVEGDKGQATFKWSRDNGSVVFGIRSLQGATVTLDSLGPDAARGLKPGDWVEIVDDVSELLAAPRPLFAVAQVDRVSASVTLAVPEGEELPVFTETAPTHPILRRWDQGTAPVPVQESKWTELEDGVQVWFEDGGDYKVGDYWQIPARTATADVLWPQEAGPEGKTLPKAMPPRGIRHHIAPLRRIDLDESGEVTCLEDCRCVFPSLCSLASAGKGDGDDPKPEPGRVRDPLGTIVFERETATPNEASIAVIAKNSERLSAAVDSSDFLEVEVRSIATETGGTGLRLAERRQKLVIESYLEAGVPARRITSADVKIGDDGAPRVESDLVKSVAGPEPARPGGTAIEVDEVPGVGKVSKERLVAAGIRDAAALARLSVDELVEILTPPGGRTFSRNRATEIIREARRLIAQR